MANIKEYPIEQTEIKEYPIAEQPVEQPTVSKTSIAQSTANQPEIKEYPADTNAIDQSKVTYLSKEGKVLFDYSKGFTLSGAAQQFAVGALNEALLGFPEYMIRKHTPLGEEVWKLMESPIEAERIIRGTGSFAGFVAGLPKEVFKVGGKLATLGMRELIPATRINRYVKAAASGASAFGLYEIIKAPKEKWEEKFTSVPLNMALGAVMGAAGEKLSVAIRIRTLDKAKALASEDGNAVLDAIKKRSLMNNALVTEEGMFLNRQGKEGYAIQKLMNMADDTAQLKSNGANVDYGIATKGLSLQEKLNFVEVLEGKKLPMQKGVGEYQHILRKGTNIEKLKQEGFNSGIGPNVLPRWNGKPTDVMQMKFSPKEGDKILYVPKEFIRDTGNGPKIKNGFKPKNENIVDYSTNSKLTKVLDFWSSERTNIEGQINSIGIKVRNTEGITNFKAIPNYFPHLIIPTNAKANVVDQVLQAAVKRGDFKTMGEATKSWGEYKAFVESGKQTPTIIQQLINSGKAKTKEEAEALLTGFASKVKQTRFGNLEFAREIDLPFYDVHPDRVLPRYFDGIFGRLQRIEAFGQDNKIGKTLVNEMQKKGLDWQNAQTAVNRFLGIGDEVNISGVSNELLSKVRNYNTATKLGLAVIPNSTQSINTYIKGGLKHTAEGIRKVFTKEGVEFAERSSNVLENSLHDIAGELTQSRGMWAGRILKWTGFTTVEKFNRIVSANAGRSYAKALAKKVMANPFDKVARRGLSELGLNATKIIEQGGLTFEDTLMAGLKMTNMTQFRARVQDLPLFWTSPEGKVLTQFKNYSFNQTKLIKDAILQEAARGNFAPMIRAVSLAPILGEGVKDVRAVLSGKKRDKEGLERIAENMAAVGGFGLVSDLWSSASYGKFAGALMGPTFSTLADFSEGMVQTVEGKPNKLIRTTVKQVPIAGSLLSNLLKESGKSKKSK